MIALGPYATLIKLAAVAAALAGAMWWSYTEGQDTVQAAWNAERVEMQRQTLRLIENKTRTEQEAQKVADQLRRNRNAQTHALELRLAESLQRLRNRPSRPDPQRVTQDPGVGVQPTGCTGDRLYGEDAAFLIREAAAANRVRDRLIYCESQYREVRNLLETFRETLGKSAESK